MKGCRTFNLRRTDNASVSKMKQTILKGKKRGIKAISYYPFPIKKSCFLSRRKTMCLFPNVLTETNEKK